MRVSRLKMVGSCRNAEDAARLAGLQQYATELGIAGNVDWVVNASYPELCSLLGGAVGGLHTMVDEHFGISVVEYMAAGAIPIAHNSGAWLQALMSAGRVAVSKGGWWGVRQRVCCDCIRLCDRPFSAQHVVVASTQWWTTRR